jgi:hypothetical protein
MVVAKSLAHLKVDLLEEIDVWSDSGVRVFRAFTPDFGQVVVKESPERERVNREVEAYELLPPNNRHLPKLHFVVHGQQVSWLGLEDAGEELPWDVVTGLRDWPGLEVELANNVLEGLDGLPVVHGDLHSGNLLVKSHTGEPVTLANINPASLKIIDFNLSVLGKEGHARGADAAHHTPASRMRAGQLVRVTPRDDLYAVGVQLANWCTERWPYTLSADRLNAIAEVEHRGGDWRPLHRQALRERFAQPAELGDLADREPELEAVLRKELAVTSKDQYADAQEFLAALRATPYG